MFAKQGFDWKKIENKPENWETVRELIKDAYVDDISQKDKYWDNDVVIDIFLELYPPLNRWFPDKRDKNKKQKKIKAKDLIIEKNQSEIIRQDIGKIQFDKQTQKLLYTKYSLEITNVLAFILWNFTFLTRKEKNITVNELSFLDAIISLTRISDDLSENFSKRLADGVKNAKKDMESFVGIDMYNLLFQHPYLLVQSSADKRRDNVKLYKEQHKTIDDVVRAVKDDIPILLGNQMPTGTGKTFLAVPLAQKLFSMKLKKTILFACSNELVCQDLASSALLGDDLHLWLSRLIRDEKTHETKILLRPYKRCFPSIWKTVYKKDDKKKNGTVLEQWQFYTHATKRIPDIIIADLEACYEILKEIDDFDICLNDLKDTVNMLKSNLPVYSDSNDIISDFEKNNNIDFLFHNFDYLFKKYSSFNLDKLVVIVEKLKTIHELKNTFVAYIDEFISDERSSDLVKKIGKILPKQSVIVSAILPQFYEIPDFVRHFCLRHRTTQEECCKRVATAVVNISCAVIDKDGYVNMPHHLVTSLDDLDKLIYEIELNPRIRRVYTAKHVYYWSESVKNILKPHNLDFKSVFPNIGLIRNVKILDYAISILRFLRAQDSLDMITTFQKYRPRVMDEIRFESLFTDQSSSFEGKTLMIANNIQEKLLNIYNQLFPSTLSWRDLYNDALKRKEARNNALQNLRDKEKDKKKRSSQDEDIGRNGKSNRIDRIDVELGIEKIYNIDVSMKFPMEYVINSKDHFNKYHKDDGVDFHNFRNKIELSDEYNDAFEDRINIFLTSGVGIYDLYNMTDYQRRLIMDKYLDLLFLCSGKEIVFGTNLPGLVNIFIDSSFGNSEHPNTLYQLMGRAGRMGRSYHANVIVNSDITLKKILDFHQYQQDPVVIDFNKSFVN